MKPIFRVREELESNYKSVYHNGKTYRFTIDDDKPISELKYPEFYDVKITSFCQGKCGWCYMNSTDESSHVKDAVDKIINFFGPMTMNQRPYQVACLHAETPVFGPNGMILIKDLNMGDMLYDSNGEKHKVINIIQRKRKCIKLNGDNGFNVVCTPDHPFLVNGGIVLARDLLKQKMDLIENDTELKRIIFNNFQINSSISIQKIEDVGIHTVFDVTLDENSNHIFVLSHGVLSHNCGGGNTNQHPDFPKILETFDSLKITPNYTSNGMGLTDEVLIATEKYCGGVALSCHPHLTEYWVSGIKKLHQLKGLKLSFHHIIYDKESVDRFLSIFNNPELDNLVHYHVLLPQIAQGRAKHSCQKNATEHLFSYLDKMPSGRQQKVAFGARFYDDLLKNKNKLPGISLYEPEAFSKFLDLKNMKIYGSSFEATAVN